MLGATIVEPALVSITVHASDNVHLIAFNWSDGTQKRVFEHDVIEGDPGSLTFYLAPGESLTQIKLVQVNTHI